MMHDTIYVPVVDWLESLLNFCIELPAAGE